MPRMKIHVGSAHIDRAVKGDAAHCMIAEAIKEKFPDARWVLVDTQSIRWTSRSEDVRYEFFTPLSAQKALVKFDRGEFLAPFSLILPEAAKVRKLYHRPKRTKVVTKKPLTVTTRKRKEASPKVTAVRQYGLRSLVS